MVAARLVERQEGNASVAPRHCHPERSEGSAQPNAQARFFASLRMTSGSDCRITPLTITAIHQHRRKVANVVDVTEVVIICLVFGPLRGGLHRRIAVARMRDQREGS
jgi:hypothetical protein